MIACDGLEFWVGPNTHEFSIQAVGKEAQDGQVGAGVGFRDRGEIAMEVVKGFWGMWVERPSDEALQEIKEMGDGAFVGRRQRENWSCRRRSFVGRHSHSHS